MFRYESKEGLEKNCEHLDIAIKKWNPWKKREDRNIYTTFHWKIGYKVRIIMDFDTKNFFQYAIQSTIGWIGFVSYLHFFTQQEKIV